jgi:hypothetical protein
MDKDKDNRTALEKFVECGGWDEENPIERLRFFCCQAMEGQDWLDLEEFIDALTPVENHVQKT